MSAFKSLTSQDVIVVPFIVNKNFTINPGGWTWNSFEISDYNDYYLNISSNTISSIPLINYLLQTNTSYSVRLSFLQGFGTYEGTPVMRIYDGFPGQATLLWEYIPTDNTNVSFDLEFQTQTNILWFSIHNVDDPFDGPFTTSDIVISITPDYGLDRFVGKNIPSSSLFDPNTDPTTGNLTTRYQREIYNSIKQLYFTNELPNPEGIRMVYDYQGNVVENNTNTNVHSRFDNYLNTTLSGSRFFPTSSNTQIGVVSLSSKVYGDYINPGTFYYRWKRTPSAYTTVVDDGEGRLLISGSTIQAGIITYQHGLAVITTPSLMSTSFTSSVDATCSFQSSRLIYETQYKCTIRENEFNYSLNPSLISGSNFTNPLVSTCSLDLRGQVYDFVTGSNWAPYVTTVGLYNDNQELLAVAKLSQPLPTSRTTDMSILINLDR